ncbi:MAG TPA: IS481 family transposase [Dokdonella sp.]
MHKNARLTPKGREALIRRLAAGERVAEVAQAMSVSQTTVRKWRARAAAGEGLADRSSRPHRRPKATCETAVAMIERLRRELRTGRSIAQTVKVSMATVSRVLRRAGLSRWRDLEPLPVRPRYQRAAPGELIHIDTKKLGRIGEPGHRVTGQRAHRTRGIGWEFVHVAIDDHARLGLAALADDERQDTAVQFLHRIVERYRALGIRVERVMTDNGAAYLSRAWRHACTQLGIKHLRTKPYTPQTNGKAERFIQSALREWAYAATYQTSAHRLAALDDWLHHYNCHRPHTALNGLPPISRLPSGRNNVLKLHS